jgi:putative DNA primase/helicase
MSDSLERKDFRQELTGRIIEELENGTAPWQKPWDGRHNFRRPVNAISERQYNGINALNLAIIAASRGFDDPRWCTYRQAQDKGWQVRKGEKGTPVEFWMFTKDVPVKDNNGKPVLGDDGKPMKRQQTLEKPIVQYFYVFNAQQMDGVLALPPRPAHEWNPIEKAERILTTSGAHIRHDEADRACYNPIRDEIHLPSKDRFASPDQYYATALHELGHWTGHSSRLNRPIGNAFGSAEYAKEELRAEIASLFLASETGVPHHIGQHAAYVKSWIEVLKNDKNEIFRAARDAEKITEYVLAIDKEKSVTKITTVPVADLAPTSLREAVEKAVAVTPDASFSRPAVPGSSEGKVFSQEFMLKLSEHISADKSAHRFAFDSQKNEIVNTRTGKTEYAVVPSPKEIANTEINPIPRSKTEFAPEFGGI